MSKKPQCRQGPEADRGEPQGEAQAALYALLELMRRLRDPQRGCPWDRSQDFRSIAPHTIEEAYELAEAIEQGDMPGVREELGDLLFQVVFCARLGQEAGAFDFADIAKGLHRKLVRRHPALFAAGGAAPVPGGREELKARERQRRFRQSGAGRPSVLAGVCRHLPALSRAAKLQQRAAAVGFDWPAAAPVLAKLEEEIAELRQVLPPSADREAQADELGDILFVCANIARHLDLDPEAVLRRANRKFERRFAHIERRLAARGRTPADAGLEEMEALWREAKEEERRQAGAGAAAPGAAGEAGLQAAAEET
ncbi:MAG: nucleoside triphosphate pyrophosphohydrolase [Gammaproteobacteria bacterium]|nr:nucleoside triphosphate pyrophosphohydrolase [Gammaproteobacteria bacterium]